MKTRKRKFHTHNNLIISFKRNHNTISSQPTKFNKTNETSFKLVLNKIRKSKSFPGDFNARS